MAVQLKGEAMKELAPRMNAPWHRLTHAANLKMGMLMWMDMLNLHRDYRVPCSCGCDKPLSEPEFHHGIISKARAMKIKGNKRLINHPFNCFLVNHECHQNIPGPQYCWDLACERYGVENVRSWYADCQKMFRRRLETYE